MTWNVNISGHDNLSGDEKIAYEEELVAKAKEFAKEFANKEGGVVSTAMASTNTTGSVNLLSE